MRKTVDGHLGRKMGRRFAKGRIAGLVGWVMLLGAAICASPATVVAGEEGVQPMFGGVIIDGYDFGRDIGPKGSIRFDAEKMEFRGAYNALKMPAGRRAIFAWLHSTKTQKAIYLGPVGWLKRGTAGKNKGRFVIKVPDTWAGGNFGEYEIIAFTAEDTPRLQGAEVRDAPTEPAGSKTLPALKPAYYLFAKLPGADTDLHYCGHGQDFFYAKHPERQTCYD